MICFKRCGHLLSPVVGIIVLRYIMGSIGHMMGAYLMWAVITHRSQHSLLNFSAWPPFSKQQEYFLSALWARWSFYCLSILGWFGYHPICAQNSWCFASPKGFESFSPGKCYFITFCRYLSKYDAWRIKNFKTIGCLLDRDTSSGRHIEVLPPPSPHVAAFT